METKNIQKKIIYEKVMARLKKEIPKAKSKILKINSGKYKEDDIKALLIDILSTVFGFNRKSDIIDPKFYVGSSLGIGICLEDEMICLMACSSPKLNLTGINLEKTTEYSLMNNYGWIVRTNCFDWEIYRCRCENHKVYDLEYVFKFLELDLEKEADLNPLYYICKEAHEPDTDIYNRLKWHGFISGDKKTIDYMFLVHSIHYQDGFAKFNVPHLNVTYRCDEGSTARILAQRAIEDFLQNKFGKTYDNEHKFVTVAYHKETEQLKNNCPVWW